ncbi:MAG: sigma-54-dependent Fis family transcriptional regulator [Myxococcales bacterium]|nr:sigma-54-dependent Fis family transcriptional regulator [Myxococcales bacterium]
MSACAACAPGDDVDHTADVRRRFVSPRLIGKSRALARVLSEAASMAPLDVGVLITGPSGTGKSELARAIHANSRRAGGPFVAVNCAAIPANLVESELFGVERGAHSTATQRTVGKVGAARGGTLFLDEVGGAAVRRAGQAAATAAGPAVLPGRLRAAGHGRRAHHRATNVDLRDRVDKQTFRADLYYRLNVVTIEMPGLADRRDDLPDLARHLCRDACARHGLPTLELPRATLAALADEPWPGQVRELANALEAGAIRAAADGATALRPPHVFPTRPTSDDEPDYREGHAASSAASSSTSSPTATGTSRPRSRGSASPARTSTT